jgi:hypothetical protein
MPLFNCNAFVWAAGPPPTMDNLIVDKKLFNATRPAAIDAFVLEVIEVNDSGLFDPPYDLADISISVETIPEVPNWQP